MAHILGYSISYDAIYAIIILLTMTAFIAYMVMYDEPKFMDY